MMKRHIGLTLVEMLVVIAIIGLLVAILLPAVQQVRESARRAQCGNSMRQIGLALHNHESAFQYFPASGWTTAGPGNPTGQQISWRISILPFIEQSNVSRQYQTSVNWWEAPNLELTSIPISIFECPSTPERITVTTAIAKPPRPALTFSEPLAPIDYEAIMGVQPDSINLHLSFPYYNSTNRFSVLHRNMRNRFSDILDGTSHTIMIVECSARPTVYRGGRQRTDISNDQGIGWADSEGPFSLDGSNADGSLEGGGPALGCIYPMNRRNDNEPFSFHPGGCQNLFADGHVEFIADSIPLLTYAGLCTMAGGENIDIALP